MPIINFHKYQAAGNDFVVVEDKALPDDIEYSELAQRICPRRQAIGADGLIIIENSPTYDFVMKYYNTDGSGPIMCGNGARASVQYVHQNLLEQQHYTFQAPDGLHEGNVEEDIVNITMSEAEHIQALDITENNVFLLDTGAPHLIIDREIPQETELTPIARPLRKEYDANVNYIFQDSQGNWQIRTYERGVEGETLACGTGVTAAALVVVAQKGEQFPVTFTARGGKLTVNRTGDKLWLGGEAVGVYQGKIII